MMNVPMVATKNGVTVGDDVNPHDHHLSLRAQSHLPVNARVGAIHLHQLEDIAGPRPEEDGMTGTLLPLAGPSRDQRRDHQRETQPVVGRLHHGITDAIIAVPTDTPERLPTGHSSVKHSRLKKRRLHQL